MSTKIIMNSKLGLFLIYFSLVMLCLEKVNAASDIVDDFLDENEDLNSHTAISRGPAATDQKTTNANKMQKKIVYTYKQYEKFDFDDLNIEGAGDIQNDLSIPPIHEKQFVNRLPYRQTFNPEIRKGIERVR